MRLLATVLMLTVSGPLMAQDLNYNYIQLSYLGTKIDTSAGDIDGDGFGIYGSLEIADSWHIFANFTSSSLDFGSEYDQTWIGGGLHTTLAPSVSLYLNLAYVNVQADGAASSFDDDGLGTALGLRMFVLPNVEVSGAISYSDLGRSGSETAIEGQGWYYLTSNWAFGAGIGFSDDVTRYGISARYLFK